MVTPPQTPPPQTPPPHSRTLLSTSSFSPLVLKKGRGYSLRAGVGNHRQPIRCEAFQALPPGLEPIRRSDVFFFVLVLVQSAVWVWLCIYYYCYCNYNNYGTTFLCSVDVVYFFRAAWLRGLVLAWLFFLKIKMVKLPQRWRFIFTSSRRWSEAETSSLEFFG